MRAAGPTSETERQMPGTASPAGRASASMRAKSRSYPAAISAAPRVGSTRPWVARAAASAACSARAKVSETSTTSAGFALTRLSSLSLRKRLKIASQLVDEPSYARPGPPPAPLLRRRSPRPSRGTSYETCVCTCGTKPPDGAIESNELKSPKSRRRPPRTSRSRRTCSGSSRSCPQTTRSSKTPGWLDHASPTMPTKAAAAATPSFCLASSARCLASSILEGLLSHAGREAALSECRLRTATEIPKKPVASAYGTTTSFVPAPSA